MFHYIISVVKQRTVPCFTSVSLFHVSLNVIDTGGKRNKADCSCMLKMHEYAITKALIDIAVEEANKAGAIRINEIRLMIGELSSIVDESVQMYFDMISENTVAQGAKLFFKRMPAKFLCKACGCIFDKPPKGFDCPKCGGAGILADTGGDMYIESIDVD